MAMREIEPYIFDPESDSELEVHKGQRRKAHTRSIEVTFELDQTKEESPVKYYEDDEISEEEEDDDDDDASSDEDWVPQRKIEVETAEVKGNSSSDEFSDDEEEELNDDQKGSYERKKRQLCTDCGSFYWTQNHICEHKTKHYVCNVCGKRCVTPLSLKIHSNIHSETYEHYCKYCCESFKTKLDKLAHEKNHQNQPKPYQCPDCSMKFASKREQRTHLKSHRGKKQFICDICGIVMMTRNSLERHVLIHTGMKPYKCSTCKRTFTQPSHLKSHMRVHTGEQPYKCQHCGKSYNHNVSLKSHIQRYHPTESGDKDEKTSDDASITVENVKKSEPKMIQQKKVKKTLGRYATGRPPGRPRKINFQDSGEPKDFFSQLKD
ncbi:unnamed protein product [Knipowitschia caucasica]